MKIVPANKTVLTVPVLEKQGVQEMSKLVYSLPELPFFEVVAVSEGEDFWRVGDLVVSNSTGTKVKVDGRDMYLFKTENLAARKNA